MGKLTRAVTETAAVFGNGRALLLLVLVLALVGVTALGILHDIDGQSVVAIYSAVIGGAIGHANGNLQGRLAAERERMLADAANHARPARGSRA